MLNKLEVALLAVGRRFVPAVVIIQPPPDDEADMLHEWMNETDRYWLLIQSVEHLLMTRM